MLLWERGLVQHINFPTHRLGNTFDFFITPISLSHLISDSASEVFESDYFLLSCCLNYFLLSCCLNFVRSHLSPHLVTSRSWRNLNSAGFERDLKFINDLLNNSPISMIDDFFSSIDRLFVSLMDFRASLSTHFFHPSFHSHFHLSENAFSAIRWRRKIERQISSLRNLRMQVSDNLLDQVRVSSKLAHATVNKSRAAYLNLSLSSVTPSSKAFQETANSMLHKSPPLPPRTFAEYDFFVDN